MRSADLGGRNPVLSCSLFFCEIVPAKQDYEPPCRRQNAEVRREALQHNVRQLIKLDEKERNQETRHIGVLWQNRHLCWVRAKGFGHIFWLPGSDRLSRVRDYNSSAFIAGDERKVECWKCHATYTMSGAGEGKVLFDPRQVKIHCSKPDCKTAMFIWERDLGQGTTWPCKGCGSVLSLDLGISFVPAVRHRKHIRSLALQVPKTVRSRRQFDSSAGNCRAGENPGNHPLQADPGAQPIRRSLFTAHCPPADC